MVIVLFDKSRRARMTAPPKVASFVRFASVFMATLIGVSACATAPFAHNPSRVGAGDPQVLFLAQRARDGDKHAQLELGIRFEEGRGVVADLPLARRFYRAAAEDVTGTIPVWLPAAGRVPGHIILVAGGRRTPGLVNARVRLGALDAAMKQSNRSRDAR
ncbi:MAG TPA: SEL1-like repeat protein [Allosphingosinicella sp.]